MKKVLSVFICTVLVICSVFPTFSAQGKILLGDADSDNSVTILDATRIQRTVAELDVLDDIAKTAADVDSDGELTVLDATRIQRYIAELCNLNGSTPYNADTPIEYIDAGETETPTEVPETEAPPTEAPPTAEPTSEPPTVPAVEPTAVPTEAPTTAPEPMLPTPKITYVSAGNEGAILHWNLIAGAECYIAFVKQNGSWKVIGTTTSNNITYTRAQQNTSYTYTVRCASADGKKFTSDYDRNGYTAKFYAKPVVTSVTVSGTLVTVRWSSVGAAKYRLFVNSGNGWTNIADTTASSYSYYHTDINTTEYYTVRCLNSNGSYFTSGFETPGTKFVYVSLANAPYIANSNTKKFHYSTCNDVSSIKPANKVGYRTRAEAIADGYTACKHCNP